MIAFVKDMKRPWLFATPAFLFQIFAVSTRDQTTAANNAAPTCCTKTEAASNRITSARQRGIATPQSMSRILAELAKVETTWVNPICRVWASHKITVVSLGAERIWPIGRQAEDNSGRGC